MVKMRWARGRYEMWKKLRQIYGDFFWKIVNMTWKARKISDVIEKKSQKNLWSIEKEDWKSKNDIKKSEINLRCDGKKLGGSYGALKMCVW
jgi:hypothetical protein